MEQQQIRKDRVIRLDEVIFRTGLSRSTIYKRIKERTFPPKIDLGGRLIGWRESQIDEWINSSPTSEDSHLIREDQENV